LTSRWVSFGRERDSEAFFLVGGWLGSSWIELYGTMHSRILATQ
jgi:hypothetical protein